MLIAVILEAGKGHRPVAKPACTPAGPKRCRQRRRPGSSGSPTWRYEPADEWLARSRSVSNTADLFLIPVDNLHPVSLKCFESQQSLGRRPPCLIERQESYRQRLLAKERELLTGITRVQMDGRGSEVDRRAGHGRPGRHCYTKESLFQQSSSARDLLILVQAALRREERGRIRRMRRVRRAHAQEAARSGPLGRHCVACQELQEKGLL